MHFKPNFQVFVAFQARCKLLVLPIISMEALLLSLFICIYVEKENNQYKEHVCMCAILWNAGTQRQKTFYIFMFCTLAAK
jgi:hypothetical protein